MIWTRHHSIAEFSPIRLTRVHSCSPTGMLEVFCKHHEALVAENQSMDATIREVEGEFQDVDRFKQLLDDSFRRYHYLIETPQYRHVGILSVYNVMGEDQGIDALVNDLYVVPDERHHGYARLAVQQALTLFKADHPHANVCAVGFLASNTTARTFYAKLGFQPFIEEHVLYF